MKIRKRKIGKTNMIGTHVMQARQEQGLTRNVLLKMLQCYGIHMSVRTLSLLERKKRRVNDIEFLALAKVLNTTMESLWDEDET